MYSHKASHLLKEVKCPFCQKEIHMDTVSNSETFTADSLNKHCQTRECLGFNRLLNLKIHSLEKGNIDEFEFSHWLHKFRIEQ